MKRFRDFSGDERFGDSKKQMQRGCVIKFCLANTTHLHDDTIDYRVPGFSLFYRLFDKLFLTNLSILSGFCILSFYPLAEFNVTVVVA